MIFDYPDYDTTNEMGMRWYHTPDGALPSITTVLGGTEAPEKTASLENWRNSLGREKAAAKTKEATDHGTMVHLLAERYLKKEEVFATVDGAAVPQGDKDAFNSLKLKLNRINRVWGQEKAIYSSVLNVAGRFDCAGEYNGVPSIIDFKTAARVKSKSDVSDYELQLAFYAVAHNERFGTSINQGVILMAAAKGFPLEFIVPITDELIEKLSIRVDAFWAKVLQAV